MVKQDHNMRKRVQWYSNSSRMTMTLRSPLRLGRWNIYDLEMGDGTYNIHKYVGY